jgi:N-acetylmuramic acid 6-phosphate (MurNAc-6-P) etherase
MQRALADCGVEKSAIDAYIGAGGSHQMMVDDPVTLAEYFRIDHSYIDGTMTGGSSFEFHVQHGAAARQCTRSTTPDRACRHRRWRRCGTVAPAW